MEKTNKKYTTKQMGDACEMLVAAELTLAGTPAIKVPDNWPGYDVIAQPSNQPPQRISVRARTFKRGAAFVSYDESEKFDWFAVVLLAGERDQEMRRVFVIPRALANKRARRAGPTSKYPGDHYWRLDEFPTIFARFENNFRLEYQEQTATGADSQA